ncbi:MAG: hypothetical protein HW376_1620, partial [candidate division NC10 bacterium]|nr:hypothetical protein [candidate division NC10 bacterium]
MDAFGAASRSYARSSRIVETSEVICIALALP